MQIIEDRRALHRIPELELQLPKTMEYLRHALSGLSCRVFSPMDSALCAWFDFGADHAIAFRADCDGLPITERSGVEFESCHPGRMHACGHDGHMAMALELARRLDQKRHLPHNVLVIFQPGEESPGGAKPLCDTGLLREYHVRAIFGLHLWPGLESGEIFSRELELMSRSCEINVDFTGRSAHIAKASHGIDALAAATEFYRRAVEMEASLPAGIFRLLKFGRMEAGTVRNAIAAHARLEGSLRAFQDDIFDGLLSGLHRIAAKVEAIYGCAVRISNSDGYPAVMNTPALYRSVRMELPFRELAEPSMTSEDFGWYQRHVPGVFFFLGVGDTPALHANDFRFDDSILVKGADFLEKLAEMNV